MKVKLIKSNIIWLGDERESARIC